MSLTYAKYAPELKPQPMFHPCNMYVQGLGGREVQNIQVQAPAFVLVRVTPQTNDKTHSFSHPRTTSPWPHTILNARQVVPSTNGLLSTVGFKLAGQPCTYALEGSIAYAGSTVQWLRDNLEVSYRVLSRINASPVCPQIQRCSGVVYAFFG